MSKNSKVAQDSAIITMADQ